MIVCDSISSKIDQMNFKNNVISSPTFEVFGQVVGSAQFLKKKWLPMHVHLSRPCYELLFKPISAEFVESGKQTYKDTKFVAYIATVKFKK